MSEVMGPIGVMMVVAVAAGVGSWTAAGRRWLAIVLGIAAVGVLVMWGVWLADSLLLVRILPVTDALVWLNPQPIAAAVLAGVAWRRMTGPVWQRVVLVVPLALLGPWRAYGHMIGDVPALQPHRMTGPVVRQSTLSTCSPAAAATALRQVGIDADEATLARLCLTREAGTTQLGLWRGLRRATRNSGVQIVPFRGTPEALVHAARGPAVISIALIGQPEGWLPIPGNRHAVTILGFSDDGTADVADPFSGRQRWPLDQLRQDWIGEAILLHRQP